MKESGLLLGALIVGGGIYLASKQQAQQSDGIVDPNTKKANPLIPSDSATPPIDAITLMNKYVFVDNPKGERIFAEVSKIRTLANGLGKNPIINLPNHVEAGIATGILLNSMIEVTSEINGKTYTYWIDSAKTKIYDALQRDFFIWTQKTGRRKSPTELNQIINYYKSK